MKRVKVVIDSVTMKHIVRPPKPSRKSKRPLQVPNNPLHEPIRLGKLQLALDASKGLISEWERTCGPDIRVLETYWVEQGGIHLVQNPPNYGSAISRRLKILGFGVDTIDKLVLRIALGTKDRTIISDDSDFWDPKKRHNNTAVGNRNAPVAKLCRDELGVTILLFGMLLIRLSRISASH